MIIGYSRDGGGTTGVTLAAQAGSYSLTGTAATLTTGAAPCSAFTIPTTANLVAWIDACVAASFTLASGAVQTAVDQSSNGYVFSSGAVGPQYNATGFNGRPTLEYSDAGTLCSLNYPTVALGTGNTLTIFAAASLAPDIINGFHAGGRLMSYTTASHDTDNDGSFALYRQGATSALTFTRNSITAPVVTVSYDTKRRIIFTLKSDGTRTLYIDGVATSVAGAVANFVSPGYLSIGGSEFDTSFFGANYSGLISEIGLYSTYSDSTAVGLLDTYLKNKWGM